MKGHDHNLGSRSVAVAAAMILIILPAVLGFSSRYTSRESSAPLFSRLDCALALEMAYIGEGKLGTSAATHEEYLQSRHFLFDLGINRVVGEWLYWRWPNSVTGLAPFRSDHYMSHIFFTDSCYLRLKTAPAFLANVNNRLDLASFGLELRVVNEAIDPEDIMFWPTGPWWTDGEAWPGQYDGCARHLYPRTCESFP